MSPIEALLSRVSVPRVVEPKVRQELLGKTLEDITNQLGEADFKRSEGQIGIWQYRQANCVVDFFFHTTDASTNLSQKTALALDIRKRIISQPLDEVRCQKELYQRQMKG